MRWLMIWLVNHYASYMSCPASSSASLLLVPFPYSAPSNTHMHAITKAVVLFDYEKQEDDELSLKVGDIITDVKQVCAACCTCMHTS